MTIKTGQPLPLLTLPVVGGAPIALNELHGGKFSILVFYRGYHCRRCNPHLNLYQSLLSDFEAQGADVIAVSADTEDRATLSVEEWGLDRLKVAYDFPIDRAPDWGLFVTARTKPEDPEQFTEPALFIIGPNRALDHGIINTAQRLRPHPADVLAHIKERVEEAAVA